MLSPTENSSNGLFDRDDVLTLKLSGEVRELLKDRSDDMQYHTITLSYLTADSAKVSFPIKSKNQRALPEDAGKLPLPSSYAQFF
jgi:hypothetical protein